MYSNVKRDDEYIFRLHDFIRREYGIASMNIAPAKRGYYGETWRLDAAEGSYFVKLDYSAAHKPLYEQSFYVIEHLCNHGIDFISRIIKTTDGRLSSNFDGAVLGVFYWIEGENIQDERTKIQEYQILAKVYAVPADGIELPAEDFSNRSADIFFSQWDKLNHEHAGNDAARITKLFDENSEKLVHRAERLKLFAERCRPDKSHFYITHGDAGGNVIVSGGDFYIVDWDAPVLAPPERDAWFCIYWDWAITAFNNSLRQNGIDYALRPERMAYYCYHAFFTYLTEYMDTYFDIGNRNGDFAENLRDYFECWIEEEIRYADKIK